MSLTINTAETCRKTLNLGELKSSLVNNILENIQNLYFKLHIDEADNINRRFIDLYEDGDINKLKDFNEQLNIVAEMYRV